MNRQIRRVTIALLLMFGLLIGQLTRIQVVDAKNLQNDPRNGRTLNKNFNEPRGFIQTADGVVLAKSTPVAQGAYGGRFKYQREYPEGDLYAQTVGYYSYTYGNDGIESVYDKDLRGKNVNITNALKSLTQSDYTENLTMTLNSTIQKIAQQKLGNRKGSVVALNPQDGSVYAMWSFPSFDPNALSNLDQTVVRDAWNKNHDANADNPMLDRSYRETYPPGSTFKTVTAAAAIESKPNLVTKNYPVTAALKLPGTTSPLTNFGGGACGGQMASMLQVSCDTGFASVGIDLGPQLLYNQATKFGFNVPEKKQPFDLPAVSSIFPDPTSFIHDTPGLAKSAIGQQDVRATPLEMAMIASGIGNDGVIMKPHVMKEIRDGDDNVVRSFGAQPWLTAMSSDGAASLRDMMIKVVTSGTGTAARIPGVTVAGKTGTAQTVGKHSHAWFIGFAPAENPVVAVAVIVESQPGVGDSATGGTVAAPIAKSVMQAVLALPPAPNK